MSFAIAFYQCSFFKHDHVNKPRVHVCIVVNWNQMRAILVTLTERSIAIVYDIGIRMHHKY